MRAKGDIVENPVYIPMDRRVEQFRSFYQRENERPLLGFFLGSEYPLFRYNAAKSLPEGRNLGPDDFPIEGYLDDYERLFLEHESCGGDFIWSASAFWGVPWLEAALGCPIAASHTTGSIASHAPRYFQGVRSLPDYRQDNAWIKKLEDFVLALAKHSQGRWPLASTRLRGISDLLSTLYGGERLIFAMLEKPEEVREVGAKLTDFWIAACQGQMEHMPLFHGGIGSFYYNMWAPAGTVWMQEDSASFLSPQLYEEFIRPYDEQIYQAFPNCILHLHSTGYIPLDAYLESGLLAVEMHIDEGGPSAEELYSLHMKVLAKKPLLIWGDLSKEDLDWVFHKLPPAGLAVCKVVSTPQEAHDSYQRYVLSKE